MRFILRSVFAVLLLSAASAAFAAGEVTYGPGCFKCAIDTTFYGAASETCSQVPNNSSGDGIYCKEQSLMLNRWCVTTGGACYYTEVTGGGGGGGNQGGDGGGPRNDTGGCSAEYASSG